MSKEGPKKLLEQYPSEIASNHKRNDRDTCFRGWDKLTQYLGLLL